MTSPVAGCVDLRSDTVTTPSPAMRRAMAEAEVGDDRYGEDPAVNRLQDFVAELTGKESAVYLPTGRLCNQIALRILTRPGHVVICEASAHVATLEAASAAAISGSAFRRVPAPRGLISAAQVAAALAPDPCGVDMAGLVAMENTHQLGGGSVMPVTDLEDIKKVCAEEGVPLYLDGARIFNACTVTGSAVADYAAQVDAVMFCLSKGLGAPVGSVLAGDASFIAEARHLKIVYGAGWRQAGIMAAAGMVALREGPKRLAEDHELARQLADGVAEALPVALDPAEVQTNIVFADISHTGHDAEQWRRQLARNGLLTTVHGERMRMLTHSGVSRRDIGRALGSWRRTIAELRAVSKTCSVRSHI